MAKVMPKAGRPHRTAGSKAAPRTGGATQGAVRDRARAADGKNPAAPKPDPQGGTGS